MKTILFALVLILVLLSVAASQENQGPASHRTSKTLPAVKLPFCPSRTCLYYAGDFNPNQSGANGVANCKDAGSEARVYQGVKPTADAVVTGATFNELFESAGVGVNPTPFEVRTGITSGHGGRLVCRTHGNATMKAYGQGAFGLAQYSYTTKKLASSCKLQRGEIYFVNLLPTYTGSNWAFSLGVAQNAKDHRGWPNLQNESYGWYPGGGENYAPLGELFSIALTGTEGK